MRAFSILVAAAAGALATYFLDPEQGRRRRARTRDELASRMNRAADAGRSLAAGMRQRTARAPVPNDAPGNPPGLQG